MARGRFQLPSWLDTATPEQVAAFVADVKRSYVPPTVGRKSRTFKRTRYQAGVEIALLRVRDQGVRMREAQNLLDDAREEMDHLILEAIVQGASTTEVAVNAGLSRKTVSKIANDPRRGGS